MHEEDLLIIAASEHDANMLYAAGFFATDPFIYARVAGKGHVFVNDPELQRVRGLEPGCRVHSLNKAHIRYLEAKLISLARDARTCTVDNSTVPPAKGLGEAEKDQMEAFLDEMLVLLPLLGVTGFTTVEGVVPAPALPRPAPGLPKHRLPWPARTRSCPHRRRRTGRPP